MGNPSVAAGRPSLFAVGGEVDGVKALNGCSLPRMPEIGREIGAARADPREIDFAAVQPLRDAAAVSAGEANGVEGTGEF